MKMKNRLITRSISRDRISCRKKLTAAWCVHSWLNGEIAFGTKMGITDIAKDAEKTFARIDADGIKMLWIIDWLTRGYTPIFEYIAPNNRIVVGYDDEDLVFLALRRNLDGEYIKPDKPYPGTCVREYGTLDSSIQEYIKRIRNEIGREGDVLVFDDGFRLKIKSEWYIGIHSIKDELSRGRHIAKRVLQNDLDDVLPLLMQEDADRVRNYSQAFLEAYENERERVHRLTGMMNVNGWMN